MLNPRLLDVPLDDEKEPDDIEKADTVITIPERISASQTKFLEVIIVLMEILQILDFFMIMDIERVKYSLYILHLEVSPVIRYLLNITHNFLPLK